MAENTQTFRRFRFPPTYFNLSWISMVSLRLLFPEPQIVSFPYKLLGILFLLLGPWMNLWASSYFKKVNTTVKPFEISQHLVTSGFFSISRHPMHLWMVSVLLGVALLLETFLPFLIIPVFMYVINRKFIIPEEQLLIETFGQDYLDYKNRVRRWI